MDINAQQKTQFDVQALISQLQGLRNQRNAAFDDAAELYGKLQSAENLINQLLTKLQTYENAAETTGTPLVAAASNTDKVEVANDQAEAV